MTGHGNPRLVKRQVELDRERFNDGLDRRGRTATSPNPSGP
jgi:hypothetical protein